LPAFPKGSYGSRLGVRGEFSVHYNWERPPTLFERHGRALMTLALLAGGISLTWMAIQQLV
jgi:hypothetical protein